MSGIKSVFLVVVTFLLTPVRGDVEVSCVFMESCILPCEFQAGAEVVIHWFQLTAGNAPVHSYYQNPDQLVRQSQRFRGRTKLFKDQISRGNASLQLTGVEIQDQGRYKCYTSNITGNNESFINLNVDAPVRKINIQLVENRIICSSDGIYPAPKITWSIIPPSYTTLQRTTDVQLTEQQLYSISSSLMLSDNVTDLVYICTISTLRNSWRAALNTRTIGLLYPFPMDCIQIMKNGNKKSDIYTVFINSDFSKPIVVYCDMDTDGGGWLMLQRRTTGTLDFMRPWTQYVAGFGNMTDEFWIGLHNIFELTNTPTQYQLRFDLGLGSQRAYAVYDDFKISSPRQRFKLTIGNYSGTAGDSMAYHRGQPWSTFDNDNDIAVSNCALSYQGAWWHKNCHRVNLNGKWGGGHSKGVNWYHWMGHETSLDFTEMKIRPLGACPAEGGDH